MLRGFTGSLSHDEKSRQTQEGSGSSFLTPSKREDVQFLRMETPSQLKEEYEFGPIIGEGTFGVVYSGIRRKDNTKCAIKRILREHTFSAGERARLDREISILRYVKHPGIIELFAVAESPKIIFLITELCEGNSLACCLGALPPKSGFEEYIVVEIIRQVASALSYLHNRGIVHRDLKAGNIMLLHPVELSHRKLLEVNKEADPVPTLPQPIVGTESTSPRSSATNVKKPKVQPSACHETSVSIATQRPVVRGKLSSPSRIINKIRNGRQSTKIPVPSSAAPPLHLPPQTVITTAAVATQLPSTVPYVPQSADEVWLRTPPPSTAFSQQIMHSVRPASVTQLEALSLVSKTAPADLRTKLIDFGLAIEVRKTEDALANPCGTPIYMAPEVLQGRSYTRQCDMWSLGILFFQLLTNRIPFAAQNEEQLIEEVANFDLNALLDNITQLGEQTKNCLLRVLHMDPAYRYSASELLLDPWILMYSCASHEEVAECDSVGKICDIVPTEHPRRRTTGNSDAGSKTQINPGSRPPSVGGHHSTSTYSATNVLQLMKQYHKELVSSKLEAMEKPESQATP